MIKKHLKLLLITSVIILLPILVGAWLWDQLPQEMPIHWNANGEIDGFAAKPFAVFGLPLILLAAQWLVAVVTSLDPKSQNHTEKLLTLSLWLIPVLNVLLSAITYRAALGKQPRLEVILPVFLGLLFTVIGNYLPKCKQNYTVGIKIPFTLHSEENWNKTHRLAGFVWVVGGIAITLMGFFGILLPTLGVILVMTLVPFIYSYILHRKGI